MKCVPRNDRHDPAYAHSVPRASALLSPLAGPPGLSEADVRTSCPSCGHSQRLDQALYLDGDPWESTYCCAECTLPLLLISPAGPVPWEGRGFEVAGWLLRNPTDVFCRPSSAAPEIRIPASPDALD